jgi:two-component system, cell cycle sensor histidine kinase and response regulator CckA
VSPAVDRLIGVSAPELMQNGMAWMRAVHPDDVAQVQASVQATAHGEGYDHRYRVVRTDGTRWIHARTIPIIEPHTPPGRHRYIGVARDLTAQHRAEQSASDQQSLLAAVVSSAMDAIISLDEQHRIVVFNAAAEQIFGITAVEVIGTTLDRFLPDTLRSAHTRHVQHLAATGATTRTMAASQSLQALRANGDSFPIEAAISRTLVNGRPVVTVVLRDITRRSELEAQIRQHQRMEAMGRLAGGVAHDFNNLLTVIMGRAERLRQELGASTLQEDAGEIMEASRRAAGLTRQLLAFSRRQVLQPRPLDVNTVLRGMERLLRRVIGEDITIEARLSTRAAMVKADPGQLEQVILNLGINARDAMRQGGTLTLRTSLVHPAELPPVLHAMSNSLPEHLVLFSVTDTGVGMDAATAARAFEPFFTTKPLGEGTGLGLATVHGIVEQSGGIIAIESTPGQGTTLSVALPYCHEVPVAERVSPSTVMAADGGTILVVEDDDGVREIMRRTLTSHGYRVHEARNPQDAIASWGDDALDGIDLMVTDMVMPGGTGRDLALALRERRADLPVLFVSGYMADGGRTDDDPRTTASLLKPFTIPQLLEHVRRLLPSRVA